MRGRMNRFDRGISIFLAAALLLSFAGCQQSGVGAEPPETDPCDVFLEDGWFVSEFPEKGSERWYAFYYDLPGNKVINAGNKLSVAKPDDLVFPNLEPKDGSGLFIGYRYGELGWGLYFLSNQGLQNALCGDYIDENNFIGGEALSLLGWYNVKDFYELNGEYYFLHGYAGHMLPTPEGGIGRLVPKSGEWGQWEAEDYLTLPDAPYAFLVDDTDLYVAMSSKLIRIRGKIIETLAEDLFWGGLGPNSIVKIEDTLYFGVRGGVASYNLKTSEILWFEKAGIV